MLEESPREVVIQVSAVGGGIRYFAVRDERYAHEILSDLELQDQPRHDEAGNQTNELYVRFAGDKNYYAVAQYGDARVDLGPEAADCIQRMLAASRPTLNIDDNSLQFFMDHRRSWASP